MGAVTKDDSKGEKALKAIMTSAAASKACNDTKCPKEAAAVAKQLSDMKRKKAPITKEFLKLLDQLQKGKITAQEFNTKRMPLKAKSEALAEEVKTSKAAKDLTQCGVAKCKAPMVDAVKAMSIFKDHACKKGDKTACAVLKELKALLKEDQITGESYMRIFRKLTSR